MTNYEDAVDFFLRYGHVGRDTADLKSKEPTESQLRAAVDQAVHYHKQQPQVAEKAAQLIKNHWREQAVVVPTYMYLYFMADQSEFWQSDAAPSTSEAKTVVDGDLLVYRYDKNDPSARYEIYEPIDANDPDSWGEVPFK